MIFDSSTLLMISSFMEVAFIALFILIALGAVIAGLIGYKRGVFKSTYFLLGYAVLFFLALVTVGPLMKFVFNFDLSGFITQPIKVNLSLGSGSTPIEICVNATTVEGTIYDFANSFCTQVNAKASVTSDVSQLVQTLVVSFLAVFVYFLDILLILTLGKLFLSIFWLIFFKRSAPKMAKKLSKGKFVGFIENVVTYLALVFLFISPLTSLVNSVNQGFNKSNIRSSQNETVKEVVKLVDIYNDSLFARTFFNWNTKASGNESGLTFDSAIINYFSKTANGGVDTESLSKEITNLCNVVGDVAAIWNMSGDISSAEMLSDMIGSVMTALSSSELLTALVETGIQLALDSDLLQRVLPNGAYIDRFNFDEEEFSFVGEIEVLGDIFTDVIDSGIVDDFVDFNTMEIKPVTNLVDYLDSLFTEESNSAKVDKLLNVFAKLDDFKLLNIAIQSLGYWGITMDTSYTFLKYVGGDIGISDPYADEGNKTLIKDFISDIHLGHELHMIFDSLWGLSCCGDHMIKNTYNAFSATDETVKQEAKEALVDTLTEHETMVKFRDSICGASHMNADGTAPVRDTKNGQHYALMDSHILEKLVNNTNFAQKLFENFDLSNILKDSYADSSARWTTLMDEVYADPNLKPIGFFKNEVNSILTVVTDIVELKIDTVDPVARHKYVVKYADDTEEPTVSDETTEFVYKDYDSLLEAAVNLFDGWINKDDIIGSILNLDSKIAPYLSKMFKCLISLDDSRIVSAVGIPIVASKIESIKEKAGEYFDCDLVAETIRTDGHVFKKISDFFSANMIGTLQHFYAGFLMNDEGVFSIDALTSLISTDIGGFLNKLNDKIIVTHDDPSTPENETVLDTHPLKYYLSEFLKGFYNFELFNPQTGENANKNIKQLLNVVFGYMEPFGVEKPTDEIYAGLDGATQAETKAKWEAELTAISDLFAVIGENRMLAFSDFSSNINTALLYSLANNEAKAAELDPENAGKMPKNLGGVLNAVGDSYLLSNVMGSLLDSFLDGTICDTAIEVKFSNITTGAGWKQEGDTMSKLLNTIAQLDLDLNNLDFTKINDYVALNDMLHSLSDSQIFKSSEGNKFGEWLYSKVETAMSSMSGGLLDDPTGDDWDTTWETIEGIGSEGTDRIAHYDFLYRNGYAPSDYENNKNGWNNELYTTKIDAYKASINYSTMTNSEVNSFFGITSNIDTYYNSVLQYDEIGRLVNVLARGISLMGEGTGIDFNTLTADDLGSLLFAINNTDCLRIAAYNAMKLAKSSIGSNDFVNIDLATFDYLITTGESLTDYSTARTNRGQEIQHIVNFYGYYKDLQGITGDSLNASDFFNKAKLCQILGIDETGVQTGTDVLSNMLAELHNTQCFNLAVSNNPIREPGELSFFEDMMQKLMNQSGLLDLTEADSATMITRVEDISYCEMYGSTNLCGYNSAWVEYDTNNELVGGEILSLMGVLKSVVGITEGSSIDANSISITSIPAAKVTKVMQSVNGSYLCTGVMKHFVTSAFTGGLGLESLLKYDASDANMVANFDLTYTQYGGFDNSCGVGTEIYNFYTVLNAMQYKDPLDDSLKFVSLSDLSSAISSKSDCFDGIFYFLYNSQILDADYNDDIKGRSIMLYNSLSSFDSYLIGSDKADKMAGIEKIFTLSEDIDNDYYKIEANGITRIIDAAGNSISDVTIDSLRTDPTLKEMILNVVKYTYDRNDGNTNFTTDTSVTVGRAYFASEIVAGIFDGVLDEEYTNIGSSFTPAEVANIDDFEKFYFASKSGGGKAASASDISATTFDNINNVELIGLDGMISMTEFINGDADRTGADPSSIASNPFVLAMTQNSSTIRAIFTDKLHNNGQDSRIAKVLYISRGAKTVENETTNDGSGNPANAGLLVLLKYATNLPGSAMNGTSEYVWKVADGFTNDFYDASFSFEDYGNNLMNYIDSCTATV